MVISKSNTKYSNKSQRGSSNLSRSRLIDENNSLDEISSSINSCYKLKIDSMFCDHRSIISQQCDDRREFHSTRSIVNEKEELHKNQHQHHPDQHHQREQNNCGTNFVQLNKYRISNNVQAQIERMFTDVVNDGIISFPVKCLGSLLLKQKVATLQEFQEPLKQLFMCHAKQKDQHAGQLDICRVNGLKIKTSLKNTSETIPFCNISIWAAVKFVISPSEKDAAFLPLVTLSENIDLKSLFRPLTAADQKYLSSALRSPIFAVVIRSSRISRFLECHGFVCQTPDDAILIAATLYQSLLIHLNTNFNWSTKLRTLCDQIGVAYTNTGCKKQQEKKAQSVSSLLTKTEKFNSKDQLGRSLSVDDKHSQTQNSLHLSKDGIIYHAKGGNIGDILTRVAIPRTGSFLNTTGLTRYKSSISKRNCGKINNSGGSPLGFSDLFNEFKLHENLHSLDEILDTIINVDGMSFNDLRPIYKEFLLKLAVTLTKDELYQRSKSIMRRQKKTKLKNRMNNALKKNKNIISSSKGLKTVFLFDQLRSCVFKKLFKTSKLKHLKNKTNKSNLYELRNENTLSGINRNSSSGYVSCSECSCSSEACICKSTDKCYCSLKLNSNCKKRRSKDYFDPCEEDNKCYCSMDDIENASDTIYCDSDSCVSSSRCYCRINNKMITSLSRWNKKSGGKLRLDYDLFSLDRIGDSVNAHKVLSVKKSAEAAATFADMKIVQKTDIKSFEIFADRIHKDKENNDSSITFSNGKIGSIQTGKRSMSYENCYQSVQLHSASLENSLGYLP